MPTKRGQEAAEKLCDEVMATISVAVNLNLDRRVSVVASRTIKREKILEECIHLLGEEEHVSSNYFTLSQARSDTRQG